MRAGDDHCPGVVRLHEAADGPLARLRIPGGLLTAAQAGALADVADELGDGRVRLTARGNVELRAIRDATALTDALSDAGLLPSVERDRVRNVVATPLAGLDGRGHADATSWIALVGALDAALVGEHGPAGLSGRFLFGLDDGRGDVAALRPDVLATLTGDGRASLTVDGGGDAVVLGRDAVPAALVASAVAFVACTAGATGDTPTAWRLRDRPGDDALRTRLLDAARAAASGAAATPAAAGDASVRTEAADLTDTAGAAHVAEPAGTAHVAAHTENPEVAGKTEPSQLAGTTQPVDVAGTTEPADVAGTSGRVDAAGTSGRVGASGRAATPGDAATDATTGTAATDAPAAGSGIRPGPFDGPTGGGLVALLPLGECGTPAWRAVAALAAAGDGVVRTTSERGVVVAGFPTAHAGAALAAWARAGLVVDADDPMDGVSACVGRPGCARARADVRAMARAGLAARSRVAPGERPLVHFSACERRCGHPGVVHDEVVVAADGIDVGVWRPPAEPGDRPGADG
ncbi:hypothetical protein [Agilicoccus flavus]|uniref:hypothetical protein n=1 Tax=Agilicoccus flavus TaxID=2775968 RepID=UPI001CF63682|nr:hypothetical protein [Agilicoccus flavus]